MQQRQQTTLRSPRQRRREWGVAALTGAGALLLYARTLAPSLVEGDNAELISAVHILGVPHPTGYPLLLIVAKALELALPIGSVAFRLNLVSAIFGATAAALMAWTAARASGKAGVGLLAGVLVALGPALWRQSLAFEVYSLHALLVALLLAALVGWQEVRTRRWAYLVALIAGLSLAHHRTALFFALPAWCACVLATPKRDWPFRIKMALLALAPSSLYLLLIPLAARQPELNWGSVQLGWGYWWRHITGAQYGRFVREHSALPAALAAGRSHWAGLMVHYTPALGPLALVGLWATRRSTLVQVMAIGTALSLAWAYLYGVSDALVFALAAEMALACWAAFGLAQLPGWLRRLPAADDHPALPRVVTGLVGLALVAYTLAFNFQALDQSQNWRIHQGATMTLTSLPRHAIFLTQGDTASGSMCYLQCVERMRPDVTVVPMGLLAASTYLQEARDPVIRQAGARTFQNWRRPAAGRGRDLDLFCQQFVRELMPRRGSRRIFAYFAEGARAPEFVWRDDGLTAEPLAAWPSLEQPAPGQVPPAGSLSCLQAWAVPASVRPGQLFQVTLRWQLGLDLPRVPAIMAVFTQGDPRLGIRGPEFARTFPLCYGRSPLPRNRPQYAYVQTVPCMAPMNSAPGSYSLLVMVGRGDRLRWLMPAALQVRPR